MIAQTAAMFVDAYRELNAKRLFWVTLWLSALVVVVFTFITVRPDGEIALFGRPFGLVIDDRGVFFTELFVKYGIGIWLTLGATVLAIISTAGLFPDLIAGGSIDLYLSKPMSRVRLFLTKYAAALGFVALQIGVFCAASFLVIGLRGGVWQWRIWLGVPIVLCFFSYLYAISVLFGVLTRSTIAAILLTVLAWGMIFILHTADVAILAYIEALDRQQRAAVPTLTMVESQIAGIERTPEAERSELDKERLDILRKQREGLRITSSPDAKKNWETASRIVVGVKTLLPKTTETTKLLERWTLPPPDVDELIAERTRPRRREPPINEADAIRAEAELNKRSPAWVIGTSLAFEAAVLAIAAWVFSRRDY